MEIERESPNHKMCTHARVRAHSTHAHSHNLRMLLLIRLTAFLHCNGHVFRPFVLRT
jgi:hypothetical protein